MTWAEIVEMSAATGRPLSSFLVLAPNNDPYRFGHPSQAAKGEWFAQIWESLGSPNHVHLRRLHYSAVSQRVLVLMLDGSPYHNTQECWAYLLKASLIARANRLIPRGTLIDMRSPDPILFESDEQARDASFYLYPGTVMAPEYQASNNISLPGIGVFDPTILQPYRLEIWIEKSTMNDVLGPVAERTGTTFRPFLGECTEFACADMVAHTIRDGRPTRILYISDHDPGGASMPVAMARKVEFIVDQARLDGDDPDIEVQPIALTAEQVAKYDLPKSPIKESERRAARFEAQHGSGAVELDALEALYPGQLAKIVKAEIARFHDDSLRTRIWKTEAGINAELRAIHEEEAARHADKIARADAEWQAMLAGFNGQVDAFKARVQAEVLGPMEADLRRCKADLVMPEWPEPREADAWKSPLYSSGRNFHDQVRMFKRHQGKEQL